MTGLSPVPPLRIAATLLACLAAAAGQPRGATKQDIPTIKVTPQRVVEITVVATTANGVPANDVRESEIRITDNGRPQRVASFEKLTAGPAPANTDRAAVYYTVVLDALNTSSADEPAARLEALRILGELGKGDATYLLILGSELRVVHDFTSKKLALLGKLADAGGVPSELPAGRLGEFAWVFDELKPAGLFGRDGVVESRRSASTLGAMRVAASNLSRLPGGKNIIWIGAGLSGGSLGSPLQPGATPGRGPSGTEVARMARIFTDCNAAFYWIDARPGAPAEAPGDAAMKEFARVSGGRVYSGGAHDAVRQALADTRVMYVVNFTPTSPEDGQYHQLKVQVTRPNVSVRYRDGYTSPAKRNE